MKTEEEMKKIINRDDSQLFRAVESTPSCLKILNSKGKLLFINPKGLAMIGAKNEDSVLGADSYEMVTSLCKEKFKLFNERICQGECGTLIFEIECLNGTKKWLETHASPFELYDGEQAHIAITNDITERVENEKQLEKQRLALIESSRLAALGQLSAGIAHEINNPLSIICANNEILLNNLKKGDVPKEKIVDKLKKIEETVTRITKIIKGLKSFSRGNIDDPVGEENLSEIIEDALSFTQKRINQLGIDLKLELDKSISAKCRAVEISQVLMNLLNNAIDAVEDADTKWVKITLKKEPDQILISVKDSGRGIDKSVHDSIMNPFFTTKKAGKGTGLGLSISYGIMKRHGGRIKYCKDTENTEFKITLPTKKI